MISIIHPPSEYLEFINGQKASKKISGTDRPRLLNSRLQRILLKKLRSFIQNSSILSLLNEALSERQGVG
uniref:Uncharacterized protein n=1 Tax=Strongyloides venezuelensis TaxID=75913 RepID=A0A0K0G5W4_STRVS